MIELVTRSDSAARAGGGAWLKFSSTVLGMARLAPLVAAAVLACASAQSTPVVIFHAPDVVELRNGFVRTLFNLTRGSLDIVQVRLGTATELIRSWPTVLPVILLRRAAGPVPWRRQLLRVAKSRRQRCCAGETRSWRKEAHGRVLCTMFHYALCIFPCSHAAQAGTRRGALAVVLNGVPGGPASTASFDRSSPLPFTLLSNGTGGGAAFSVSLGDAGARVNATLVFGLDAAAPRRLWVNATAAATAAFSPTLVALDFAWAPPNAIGWCARGGGSVSWQKSPVANPHCTAIPPLSHPRSQVRGPRRAPGHGHAERLHRVRVVPRAHLRHRWVHRMAAEGEKAAPTPCP